MKYSYGYTYFSIRYSHLSRNSFFKVSKTSLSIVLTLSSKPIDKNRSLSRNLKHPYVADKCSSSVLKYIFKVYFIIFYQLTFKKKMTIIVTKIAKRKWLKIILSLCNNNVTVSMSWTEPLYLTDK